MIMGRAKYYREYHELFNHERITILRAFKRDYQGNHFRDRFMISRNCLRRLKEDSKTFLDS